MPFQAWMTASFAGTRWRNGGILWIAKVCRGTLYTWWFRCWFRLCCCWQPSAQSKARQNSLAFSWAMSTTHKNHIFVVNHNSRGRASFKGHMFWRWCRFCDSAKKNPPPTCSICNYMWERNQTLVHIITIEGIVSTSEIFYTWPWWIVVYAKSVSIYSVCGLLPSIYSVCFSWCWFQEKYPFHMKLNRHRSNTTMHIMLLPHIILI